MKCGHLTITEGLLVSLEGVSKSLRLQVTVPGSLPQEVENKCPPVPEYVGSARKGAVTAPLIDFYPSWCSSYGREPGFGGGGAGFGAPIW